MNSLWKLIPFCFVVAVALLSAPEHAKGNPIPTLRAFMSQADADRLQRAIRENDSTTRNQILRSHSIFTFNDFLNRVDDRLRPIRDRIETLEAQLDKSDVGVLPMLENLEKRYSQNKLSYDQLSAVLLFYITIDPDRTVLIEGKGATRVETRVANQAVRVTRWAYVPRRRHGADEPPPPFDRDRWASVHKSFSSKGLTDRFVDLWSQLVNIEGRHQTYRHIEGFSDMFYMTIRKIALKGDPFRARILLLSSLANTRAEGLIEKYGLDPDLWPRTSRIRGSQARFAVGLMAIKDAAQLMRLFGFGHLPPSIPKPQTEVASKILQLYTDAGAQDAETVRAAVRSCRR